MEYDLAIQPESQGTFRDFAGFFQGIVLKICFGPSSTIWTPDNSRRKSARFVRSPMSTDTQAQPVQ